MVDYSKWNSLDDSGDEEEERRVPRVTRLENPSSITFGAGKSGAKGEEPIEVKTVLPPQPPPEKSATVSTVRQAKTLPKVENSVAAFTPGTSVVPAPQDKGGSLSSSYNKWDKILAECSDSDAEDDSGDVDDDGGEFVEEGEEDEKEFEATTRASATPGKHGETQSTLTTSKSTSSTSKIVNRGLNLEGDAQLWRNGSKGGLISASSSAKAVATPSTVGGGGGCGDGAGAVSGEETALTLDKGESKGQAQLQGGEGESGCRRRVYAPGSYVWSQTKDEVALCVVVAPGTRAKDVAVEATKWHLQVKVHGQVVLGGRLCYPMQVEAEGPVFSGQAASASPGPADDGGGGGAYDDEEKYQRDMRIGGGGGEGGGVPKLGQAPASEGTGAAAELDWELKDLAASSSNSSSPPSTSSSAAAAAASADTVPKQQQQPPPSQQEQRVVWVPLPKLSPAPGVVVWWQGVFAGAKHVSAQCKQEDMPDRLSGAAGKSQSLFQQNWKEAHKMFQEKVKGIEKTVVDTSGGSEDGNDDGGGGGVDSKQLKGLPLSSDGAAAAAAAAAKVGEVES
mmetsp:Transcript_83477/g.162410  ORF Transcript_83477/g.162410 Transcript_83477/m.162410 type:complete len:564 (+) Transcript_83477:191-1882(+)